MPGRNANANLYRYSVNGQEDVDEISGVGNHTTAEYWEYDTRLGRRWNLDPKPQISTSDYACFGNNPVIFTDPLGDKIDRTSYGGVNASRKERRQIRREIKWERKNIAGFEEKFQAMKADPHTLYSFENNFTMTDENRQKAYASRAIGPDNMVEIADSRKIGKDLILQKMGYISRQSREGDAHWDLKIQSIQSTISSTNPDWSTEIETKMKFIDGAKLTINLVLLSGFKADLYIDGKFHSAIADIYQPPSPTSDPTDAEHHWETSNVVIDYNISPKISKMTDVKIRITANDSGSEVHAEGYIFRNKIAKAKVYLSK